MKIFSKMAICGFKKIDKKICFLHEKNRITTNKNNFPWNKKKINKWIEEIVCKISKNRVDIFKVQLEI